MAPKCEGEKCWEVHVKQFEEWDGTQPEPPLFVAPWTLSYFWTFNKANEKTGARLLYHNELEARASAEHLGKRSDGVKWLKPKEIYVKLAWKERDVPSTGRGRRGIAKVTSPTRSRCVLARGVPTLLTSKAVAVAFSEIGSVVTCVVRNSAQDPSVVVAEVTYQTVDEAVLAVERLDGMVLMGFVVGVRMAVGL